MVTTLLNINKLAAAKRQLQAAIRMYFLSEDELAVHTVAAAAYGLLKDIKHTRGQREAANVYKASFFYLVRDYHRGILPAHMTNDATFMAAVETIAAQLSPITADSKLSDFSVAISSAMEKKYWQNTNYAANFLKHADHDIDETLPTDQIDNQLLLMKCYCAYQDVTPDDLGNEGLLFQAFMATNNPCYQPDNTSFGALILSMRKEPAERQLEICHRLIIELNTGVFKHCP